mmetsp:Transcript_13777/g.15208  ORF Transcript_13777/g.15208 Transcript_13777/m.15208 type:complete len:116 (-) Transcript_13777:66-413(-)
MANFIVLVLLLAVTCYIVIGDTQHEEAKDDGQAGDELQNKRKARKRKIGVAAIVIVLSIIAFAFIKACILNRVKKANRAFIGSSPNRKKHLDPSAMLHARLFAKNHRLKKRTHID